MKSVRAAIARNFWWWAVPAALAVAALAWLAWKQAATPAAPFTYQL
jgi:hypothetical protein